MLTTRDVIYTNTDAEYNEICEFLNALASRDPFMHWESGRMNFWRSGVHGERDPQDPFFRENARTWRTDDDRIVALFISEYGGNDFFIEVEPAYQEIYADIFRWIDAHWATTRTEIEIDVFSGDTEKIRMLKGRGFQFARHCANLRTYDLDHVDLDYTLEDGFRVRTFAESPDYESRTALVRSAFDNPTYSEERLRSLVASPDHIPEYHLLVVSPEQQHVAYCIGWDDNAKEHGGYIEPVGTHSDYRRRGFASAVIKECFARMKANGIRTVEIASGAEPNPSNYLYDSLQPASKREVHKYARKVSSDGGSSDSA